jgi:hypothetical protein
MSTPLDIASDIAETVVRHRRSRLRLDVASVAEEIAARHEPVPMSPAEIAAALAEEGSAAGVRTFARRFRGV